MNSYDIYFKTNEEDEFATYYTTIEANSQEEAEQIAERLYCYENVRV